MQIAVRPTHSRASRMPLGFVITQHVRVSWRPPRTSSVTISVKSTPGSPCSKTSSLVLLASGGPGIDRADRMACEGQRHVAPAPVVAAAAPLLRPGALSLRGEAVVEEEARVALQRGEVGLAREDERRSRQMPGPFLAALELAGVEQDQILAGLWPGMVGVGGVEIRDVVGRVVVGRVTHTPENFG